MVREIESRPLLCMAVAFAVALTLRLFPHNLILLVLIVLVLRSNRLRAACVGFTFLGAFLAPSHIGGGEFEKQGIRGTGTISSVPRIYAGNQVAEIDTSSGRFRFATDSDVLLAYGDEVRFSGTIRSIGEDSREAWLLRGVRAGVFAEQVEVVRSGPFFSRGGAIWRAQFLHFTSATLPDRAASAVDALCFNVDTMLDPAVMSHLRRTGTVHIISASGLHVMIFALALAGAIRLLPLPRPAQLMLLVAILILYAAATGLRPPVVRSVVMALVLLYAYVMAREADGLSAMALAGLGYLLWRPSGIYEASFQLSFVIIGGLALWWRPLPARERPTLRQHLEDRLVVFVRTGWHAFVWSAPLIAYYFGSLSLVAIPANLLILPVLPAIIVPSMAAMFLFSLWPGLAAGVMAYVVEPLVAWLLGIVALISGWQFAALEVPPISGYGVALMYALLLASWTKYVRQP